MPKYLIEREIPGAGQMSASDLQAVSRRSCEVIRNLGPDLYWIESFVTKDKVLLHLHRPGRGTHPEARGAGRFSGQSHQRDQGDHRPRDRLIKEKKR